MKLRYRTGFSEATIETRATKHQQKQDKGTTSTIGLAQPLQEMKTTSAPLKTTQLVPKIAQATLQPTQEDRPATLKPFAMEGVPKHRLNKDLLGLGP